MHTYYLKVVFLRKGRKISIPIILENNIFKHGDDDDDDDRHL